MLALLPILMLALLDVGDEPRRQAAKNELQNRLGLRTERAGGDLRERLIYCLARIPESVWVPNPAEDGRRTELVVGSTVRKMLYGILKTNGGWDIPYTRVEFDHRGRPINTFVDHAPASYHQNLPAHVGRDPEGHARLVYALPPAGVRTALDPFLPWIVRELVAWAPSGDAEYGEKVTDLRSPDMLGEFLDWATDAHPDLNAMTYADAFAAIRAWHAQFAATAAFRSALAGGIPIRVFEDGSRIVRLATKRQCEEEGLSMGHCVGGHWASVRDGKAVVLSYRDPRGVPCATIELTRDGAIREFKGTKNRTVEAEAAARVLQLLRDADVPFLGVEEVDTHLPFVLPRSLPIPDAAHRILTRFIANGMPFLTADGRGIEVLPNAEVAAEGAGWTLWRWVDTLRDWMRTAATARASWAAHRDFSDRAARFRALRNTTSSADQPEAVRRFVAENAPPGWAKADALLAAIGMGDDAISIDRLDALFRDAASARFQQAWEDLSTEKAWMAKFFREIHTLQTRSSQESLLPPRPEANPDLQLGLILSPVPTWQGPSWRRDPYVQAYVDQSEFSGRTNYPIRMETVGWRTNASPTENRDREVYDEGSFLEAVLPLLVTETARWDGLRAFLQEAAGPGSGVVGGLGPGAGVGAVRGPLRTLLETARTAGVRLDADTERTLRRLP